MQGLTPLPLFHHYPALKNAIPRIGLADLPTPVEPFDSSTIDSTTQPTLWIKRDDKSSSLYGGNKVRKLEFALAEAQQQGKNRLVTFGAIGTNHGVATALFCNKLGIACRILLFDQPVTRVVQDNLKLMQHFGAELDYRGTLLRTATTFYLERLLSSSNSYYLAAGGSNLAGCLGFVNAALELKQQVNADQAPEPDFIYCPMGSGSTLAGLTLGARLAGLKSRVIGVRVAPARLGIIPAVTRNTVYSLMAQSYRWMRQLDPSVPSIELPEIILEDDFYGRGYGHSTAAGREAAAVFGEAGIKLEPTYTAKTAAAVLRRCSANPDQTILYWHTYNSADMSACLSDADPAALPGDLRWVLERQPAQ